ncbi:MAG: tail fiber domain-containing protein [Pseudomonadota bacterium]
MKSKTKTKPTKYAEPYITAAGQAQGPAFEEASAAARQQQPGLLAASQFYQDTIGGKYLGGNPHMEGVIDSTNRDIMDGVNGQFNSRFGSGYHATALARAIAENEQRLRYGDYAQERAYQNDAGGNLAGIAQTATALPQMAAGNYAQNIGGLFGQYNKTTQKQALGPALIQGAANAAGAYAASDRRLKMDIEQVGREDDGLGVYQYRYVTDQPGAPLRTGVMADEVAELRPWALGPVLNGFSTVCYGAL